MRVNRDYLGRVVAINSGAFSVLILVVVLTTMVAAALFRLLRLSGPRRVLAEPVVEPVAEDVRGLRGELRT
ncbi:MAG: hypothetical protein WCA46_05530 [Actinocatenispora sp.]